MKKIGVLLLSILFLAFSGCESDDDSGVTDPGGDDSTEYNNVAGVWDTDFGTMTLNQNEAGDVTGTYEYMSGEIQGNLTGITLNGTWTETNDEGTFIFEFNQKFTTFEGVWGYDDETPTTEWNGTRVE